MNSEMDENACSSLDRLRQHSLGSEGTPMECVGVFREEEEMFSNVADSMASPFFNTRSLIGDEVHLSSEFLPLEGNLGDEEDETYNSHISTSEQPECLALNQKNLAQFESSVQKGNIPLRTDVVGNTYLESRASKFTMPIPQMDTPAMANTPTSANASVKLSPPENGPTQAPADTISLSAMANHGTEGSDNKELTVVSSITETSQRKSGGNVMSKTDLSVWGNSSTFRDDIATCNSVNHKDPLNEKNLDLHVKKLCGESVVSLKVENIPSALPSRTALLWLSRTREEENSSVFCEPSDAAVGSETASTDFSQQRNTGSRNVQVETGDSVVVEELWSMETNQATDLSMTRNAPSLSEINGWPSLNKKSLQRLRQQIESGTVPLRPEVLSGLSGMDLRIKQVPEKSPSTFVEVPSEEFNSHKKPKRHPPDLAMSFHSPNKRNLAAGDCKIALRRNSLKHQSPTMVGFVNDSAGMSLCSMSVQASGRERIGETVSVIDGNYASSLDQDARFRDEDDEAHNEDSMYLTYGLTTVQEEVSNLKQHIKELARFLKKSKEDQNQLVQQLQMMREEMRRSLQSVKVVPLRDVRKGILNLQSQLDALKAFVLVSQPSHSDRNRSKQSTVESSSLGTVECKPRIREPKIRLNLKINIDRLDASDLANSLSRDSPVFENLTFVLMADPNSTVKDVKEHFLNRLLANKLLPEDSGLCASNTLVLLDGKVLFDSDLLEQDLQMELAPAKEYTLTLQRRI